MAVSEWAYVHVHFGDRAEFVEAGAARATPGQRWVDHGDRVGAGHVGGVRA